MIAGRIRSWLRTYQRLREAGGDPDGDKLIVFYNDMFGEPLGLNRLRGPRGVRFSGNRLRWRRADALVFHVPSLSGLPTPKPPGQLWVAWSMESESNYPQLADPLFMALFDLEMSYRQGADIWLPYLGDFGSRRFDPLLRRNRSAAPTELINSFVSSAINHSGRLEYLAELGRHLDLHAYGRVGRNRGLVEDLGRKTKLETLAHYKFSIAFENSIAEDYVTEKFYDPLVAGSVPVYLGAPNIAEFAPGELCYIDVKDFGDPRELAIRLRELDADDQAYGQYHAWRQKPLLPAFRAKLERHAGIGHPFNALGRELRARQPGMT